MKSVVHITGYNRRINVIEFIKLIRGATGAGLASTKDQVDGLLEGKPFDLIFESEDVANRFCTAAAKLGAIQESDLDRKSLKEAEDS